MAYPAGLRIFIDGKDVTYILFGANTFDPSSESNILRNLDITPHLRKTPGVHTIELTAVNGSGRVECRVEIK